MNNLLKNLLILLVSFLIVVIAVLILVRINKGSKTPQNLNTSTKLAKDLQVFSKNKIPPGGLNITVSPPIISIKTELNATTSGFFKVKNNANYQEKLKITFLKLQTKDQKMKLINIDEQDLFENWLKLSETEFKINPGMSHKIKFRLSIPNTANPSYQYGILINRKNQINPNQTDNNIVRGGSIIWLFTDIETPETVKEINLVDFSVKHHWYDFPPVNFVIKLKNAGNVHLAPFGDLYINSDIGGNKEMIDSLIANKNHSTILPNSSKALQLTWDNGFISKQPMVKNGSFLKDKNGKNKYKLKLNLNQLTNFRFGKYTADLTLVYDDGDQDIPINSSVSFWIIPWKIISILILITFIVIKGLQAIIFNLFKHK